MTQMFFEKNQDVNVSADVDERSVDDSQNSANFGYDTSLAEQYLKNCTPEAQNRFYSLKNVKTSAVSWLWYPYIPKGKITLVTADPGTGKTFFALYLAACVSSGRAFFGEPEDVYKPPAKVIYQTAEDGYSDTIKPRLEPMCPDFDNIIHIDEDERSLTLSDEVIEQAFEEVRPALFILDPIQAYLGAGVDMHRANEVRPILARIARLAEKYNCAVVFIMHHNKNAKGQALYRALGSIDVPAVARSMLIIANNPENKAQKIICHEKSSLEEHGKSMLFRIDRTKGIVFDGYSDKKADDVLCCRSSGRQDTRELVKSELLSLMSRNGTAKLSDVEKLKDLHGFSDSTLKRAKAELLIKSVTVGFGEKVTYWLLPEVDAEQFRQSLKHDKDDDVFMDDIMLEVFEDVL